MATVVLLPLQTSTVPWFRYIIHRRRKIGPPEFVVEIFASGCLLLAALPWDDTTASKHVGRTSFFKFRC
jgi:hypothetical protein